MNLHTYELESPVLMKDRREKEYEKRPQRRIVGLGVTKLCLWVPKGQLGGVVVALLVVEGYCVSKGM